ncbi:MAG: hypothetical protein JST93_24845 [Acidobacteria bacterium]|nr:hypothetical protein [Acidobacteriota bacterium]
MGREKAYIVGFPPGGYFGIQSPRVCIKAAEASWDKDDLPPDRHAGLLAIVKQGAPLRLRRAVQQFAHYFHREMGFDFIQYELTEADDYEAFVWHEPHDLDDNGTIGLVGACCFRTRRYKELGTLRALQWIWLHPYRRRRGLLKNAWPYFEKRYRRFDVEGPLSPGMTAFIKKTNFPIWDKEWQLATGMPSPPEQE